MLVTKDNNPQSVFDKHFALTCARCGTHSNTTAISIPRYEYLDRFRPDRIGIVYRCDYCNNPVFLEFDVSSYETAYHKINIGDDYTQIERAKETFPSTYLPDPVRTDFHEALTCFSNNCFNAFAAMSRRTVQSVCSDLGARGADRVLHQLKELREMAELTMRPSMF